jgi:polyisoprenyl-phosphate glycosyltransferase
MQASLIVPVYNAERTLWPLYERIDRQARLFNLDLEIVFVDDASTDGSLAILRDIERSSAAVVVVANSINRGQGNATLAGAAIAKHGVLVTLDDDLQHQPEDIPRLLAAFESCGPATLVMGVFNGKRRAFWRAMVGFGANAISNLFLDKPLPLRLTTFCVFNKSLCRDIAGDENRTVALITELVQAADKTLTVPLSISLDVQQLGNYTVQALFGLFLSRSRVYRFPRVLAWLSFCLLVTATTGALLLLCGLPMLFAGALWLVSFVASLLLTALALRMWRQAPGINRSRSSAD